MRQGLKCMSWRHGVTSPGEQISVHIRPKRKSLAHCRSPERSFSCCVSYVTRRFIQLRSCRFSCCFFDSGTRDWEMGQTCFPVNFFVVVFFPIWYVGQIKFHFLFLKSLETFVTILFHLTWELLRLYHKGWVFFPTLDLVLKVPRCRIAVTLVLSSKPNCFGMNH